MWQSRIYAFLFRKILGPYLTPESQRRLHNSINISLRDGRLEILDIELDGDAISKKLKLDNSSTECDEGTRTTTPSSSSVIIQSVHVKRMYVALQLLYFNDDNEIVEGYDDGHARLIAHVELDGVDVCIVPNPNKNSVNGQDMRHGKDDGRGVGVGRGGRSRRERTHSIHSDTSDDSNDMIDDAKTNNDGNDQSGKTRKKTVSSIASSYMPSGLVSASAGTIRSYVQSAVDSLKLSLDINDLTIHITSTTSTVVATNQEVQAHGSATTNVQNRRLWMSLNIATLSYRELDKPNSLSLNVNATNMGASGTASTVESKDSKSVIVQGKEITVDTVTLTIGETSHRYKQDDIDDDGIDENMSEEVARLEGASIIRINVKKRPMVVGNEGRKTAKVSRRRRKYSSDGNRSSGGSDQYDKGMKQETKMERDCEIVMDQELALSISVDTLERAHRIVSDIMSDDRGSAVTDEFCAHAPSTDASSTKTAPKTNERTYIDGGGPRRDSLRTDLVIDYSDDDNDAETHSVDKEEEDDDDEDLGLLANIIQQQADEQYMDNVGKMRAKSSSSKNAHACYTQRPSSEEQDDIPDFFNPKADENLAHFHSTLMASINSGGDSTQSYSGDGAGESSKDQELESSQFHFYLRETTMILHLKNRNSTRSMTRTPPMSMSANYENNECISVTLEDFSASLTESRSRKHAVVEMSAFNCDFVSTGAGTGYSLDSGRQSLIKFIDDSPDLDSSKSASQHPVLSLSVDMARKGDEIYRYDVNGALDPIQVTFHHSILLKLSRDLGSIVPDRPSVEEHDEDLSDMEDSSSPISVCQITCDRFLILAPMENVPSDMDDQLSDAMDNLFERSGYRVPMNDNLSKPTLLWEGSAIALDFEQNLLPDECIDEMDDTYLSLSFQRSIVSILAPTLSSELQFGRKFDLLAIEGETTIDPDALIRIEYSKSCLANRSDTYKKRRAKKKFPVVTPLATVKASQQYENDEYELKRGSSQNDTNRLHRKKLIGPDPQVAMLKELGKCETSVILHVPSIALDLSVPEKDALGIILAKMLPPSSDENVSKSSESSSTPISFGFKCDQISLSMHQSCAGSKDDANHELHFNHVLIFDGFSSHFFIGEGNLKHTRVLCQDMTLFEVNERPPTPKEFPKAQLSVKEICEAIRRRRCERRDGATAIFFRSKLSHPLSPSNPAILLDAIISRNEYHTERALHMSCYDLTHRYDCESRWIERISSLFESKEVEGSKKSGNTAEDHDVAVVNNLFINISDCNLDYSSPLSFRTPSRTVLRVGEIRVTSNIIKPSGSAQVFKVSLADASIYLSNERVQHEHENSKLSCARTIFGTSLRHIGDLPHSFDDALQRRNFIRIFTLDCFDSAITILNDPCVMTEDNTPAKCSVALSIGRSCLYVCKDSFACFTETLNELVMKMTMPSPAELQVMKAEAMERKLHKHGSEDTSWYVKQEERDASTHQPNTYIIQKPTTLSEVIENGLFSSAMTEEIDDTVDERNVIHDFFAVENSTSPKKEEFRSQGVEGTDPDGWTTVHHSWTYDPSIPEDEDQATRWFVSDDDAVKNESSDTVANILLPNDAKVIIDGDSGRRQPRVFSRHVPIDPVIDPLGTGDMGAARYANTDSSPEVKLRITIHDMSLDCRFFDGYDWSRASSTSRINDSHTADLMNELLGDKDKPTGIFSDPKLDARHKECRRSEKYFQFSFSGLKVRLDSFFESTEHCLASCMDLTLSDMFLVETISGNSPVKLLGEWVNEEKPRDTNDGLMMMKMVSIHPDEMFSSDGELMGNEGRVTLELLPIRFFIHQVALRFIKSFFGHKNDDVAQEGGESYPAPPEVFFPVFKVKPFDIKVDYKPKHIDTSALKEGSLVELLNVLPLEDMILRLSEVEMRNLTGWGSIISELACNWLQDVSSTQMHKFLTRTTPLHPFATVGDGMKQFLMIPLDEYKHKGSVKKGLRKGTKKLASVLAYETLSVGAKLTGFAAKSLGRRSKRNFARVDNLSSQRQRSSPLPRSMGEVSDHAIESLTRGLKEANAKMIIIPYREYQQSGAGGAMKCVVRGLPVAVCAPLSGAAEAVSYGLYGVRNQLRPDLREEEEASKRLHDLNF